VARLLKWLPLTELHILDETCGRTTSEKRDRSSTIQSHTIGSHEISSDAGWVVAGGLGAVFRWFCGMGAVETGIKKRPVTGVLC
jgi:hypothetical protein